MTGPRGIVLAALAAWAGLATAQPLLAEVSAVAAVEQGLSLRVVGGGSLPLVVADRHVPPGQARMDAVEGGAALDRALARADLPPRFAFQPGVLRPAILSLVQARLVKLRANWNLRTGDARRGQAARTLGADVLAAARASPIGAALARHGYRLDSTGRVTGVEVGCLPAYGPARLPTEIADMGLIAVRIR